MYYGYKAISVQCIYTMKILNTYFNSTVIASRFENMTMLLTFTSNLDINLVTTAATHTYKSQQDAKAIYSE